MFSLLANTKEWETYKANLERSLNVAPPVALDWGKPPTAYPCLVTTLAVGVNMYSCFVYEQDCVRLLRSTPAQVLNAKTEANEFNRDITAKMMAVIYFLTETGLCAPKGGLAKNQEAFEAKTTEMRELVNALFPT